MSDLHRPSAVVVSVTPNKHPADIIKLIFDSEELPDPLPLNDVIAGYLWHIETKYYSADINVCAVLQKTIGTREFAEGVGAVIIYFDSLKDDAIELIESWLPFLKEMNPEVQILVCDNCSDCPSVGVSQMAVQQWCVDNKFELVELHPDESSQSEDESDFPALAETKGVKRIVQALHSHLWPNMSLKEHSTGISSAMQACVSACLSAPMSSGINNATCDETDQSEKEANSLPKMLHKIDQLLGADETQSLESDPLNEFGSLLAKLNDVKLQVASLPSDQRKQHAEQVVMAFWKAIGGDEDEFADLEIK